MKADAINRTIFLYKLLEHYTDEEHQLSTAQLLALLMQEYDVSTDRLTITHDLDCMAQYGLPIKKDKHNNKNYYFIVDRLFEDTELRLLADAVECSKLIPEEKSEQLVNKILSLTSSSHAADILSNLQLTDRVKPVNQRVYIIIDAILDAIKRGQKIAFLYFEYNGMKQQVLRNGCEPYVVSPYTLEWNGDYYYLVCYTDKRQSIQHFRVDRIAQRPEVLDESIIPAPADFNIGKYQKNIFRMYADTPPVEVELLCKGKRMNQIIDNFGMDVPTRLVLDESGDFIATVQVSASPTFYRWVFGFNGDIKIISPADIRNEYRKMLQDALESIN